ncbi:MAG TPA: right-handed parallel beta-helix repeat-containing protein [Candidatus Angelobacter sp.]|nr:right-handed parallel beta-helix repeat-containing protein [Candidatus Angelobacter sp.]
MSHKSKTLRFPLFLAGIVLCAAAPASAVQCGDEIRTDLTLTSNLTCSGNALVVSGPLANQPSITIDLNGYDITGDGTGTGILILGGPVTLKGKGRISHFDTGVSINGTNDVIAFDLAFENDSTAISVLRAQAIRIFDNTIEAGASGQIGVLLTAVSHTAVYRNTVHGFAQFGIRIPDGDPPDTSFPIIAENIVRENQTGISVRGLDSDSVIRGNTVADNALNGIEIGPLFESGCTIQENRVVKNGGNGILLQDSIPNGCLVANNLVEKNGQNGISVLLGQQNANQNIQVEGNRVSHNNTDLVWDGSSNACWLQNVFISSSPQVLPKCPLF